MVSQEANMIRLNVPFTDHRELEEMGSWALVTVRRRAEPSQPCKDSRAADQKHLEQREAENDVATDPVDGLVVHGDTSTFTSVRQPVRLPPNGRASTTVTTRSTMVKTDAHFGSRAGRTARIVGGNSG
jgi:hypothetical protein